MEASSGVEGEHQVRVEGEHQVRVEGEHQVRVEGELHVLGLDVSVTDADGMALRHGLQQLEGEPPGQGLGLGLGLGCSSWKASHFFSASERKGGELSRSSKLAWKY
eukprot:scaffold76197_cov64-Phaeocystis_antarctica.AAC.2